MSALSSLSALPATPISSPVPQLFRDAYGNVRDTAGNVVSTVSAYTVDPAFRFVSQQPYVAAGLGLGTLLIIIMIICILCLCSVSISGYFFRDYLPSWMPFSTRKETFSGRNNDRKH